MSKGARFHIKLIKEKFHITANNYTLHSHNTALESDSTPLILIFLAIHVKIVARSSKGPKNHSS